MTMDERFKQASKIYLICQKSGIDLDKTRLLSYIHFKFLDYGYDYFNSDNSTDIMTIETMLGNFEPLKEITSKYSENIKEKVIKQFKNCSDNIRDMDLLLREQRGMENRMSGELRQRLKFYKNPEFKQEMLNLYYTIIEKELNK